MVFSPEFDFNPADPFDDILGSDFTANITLMLYSVVKNRFDGNARGVVANLSTNIEATFDSVETIDNRDGTNTYVYTDLMLKRTEITRDKYNGDYIKAMRQSLGGQKPFEVEFNPNGSIKKLEYVNNVDSSKVIISQSGNRLIVNQIFNGVVTECRHLHQEDKSLKQTYATIRHKSSNR